MYLLKCVVVIICLIQIGESCNLDFRTDFPENSPLIFNHDEAHTLVLPTTGSGGFRGVNLNEGDEILLACAGDGNAFGNYAIPLSSIVLSCAANNALTNGTHDFNFQNLGCIQGTKSMVLPRGESCANGQAQLFDIGFNVTVDSSTYFWYPSITSCFDPEQSKTYYSKHTLSGLGLSAYYSENDVRVEFQVGIKEVLYPEFSPEKAYEKATINNTFEQILGPGTGDQIISNKFYINKGHLAPNADFYYDLTRYASYYYINVAPQWSAVNGGTWNDLEMYIRDLAISKKTDFTVYTGTHEILTFLDTVTQEQAEIYLHLAQDETNKLAIPRFYWKIVQHTDPMSNEQKGMAFVSYNNDTIHPSTFTWPCTDICGENDWNVTAPNTRHPIICCDVKDLRRAIPEIPDINVGDGILQGVSISSFKSDSELGSGSDRSSSYFMLLFSAFIIQLIDSLKI